MLSAEHPLAVELAAGVHAGDQPALVALMERAGWLVHERFGSAAESRTALHIATDWPGHYPEVAATIALLVRAGAPVDGRFRGARAGHRETALHWAASADDLEAIDALVAAGADIEVDGAVLTGGTPLADAVVFGQWNAARRLVQHGARMTIWQAAAIGDEGEVRRWLSEDRSDHSDVTNACWHACRSGQGSVVRLLVERGADLDWVGHEGRTPRQMGHASGDSELAAWLDR